MAETARKIAKPAIVRRLAEIQEFELAGNRMFGLATPNTGARQSEVWLSRVDPDAETPPHVHNAEEILIVLHGRGEARRIGVETVTFEAPCTVILPAYEMHQLANSGREVLEFITVLPSGSKIFDSHGVEMALPWRE